MPFCPECALEYDGDILVCPTCRVGLVDQPPAKVSPAAMSPDDSWIGVYTVDNEMSSGLICGLLDSNNIPSMVTSAAFQPPSNDIGRSIRLKSKTPECEIVMVPREFQREAELLLSAILGADPDTSNAAKY